MRSSLTLDKAPTSASPNSTLVFTSACSALAYLLMASTTWIASWYVFPNESLFCGGLLLPNDDICREPGAQALSALVLMPILYATASAFVARMLGAGWVSTVLIATAFAAAAPVVAYAPEIGLVAAGPSAALLLVTILLVPATTLLRSVALPGVGLVLLVLLGAILSAILQGSQTLNWILLGVGFASWIFLPVAAQAQDLPLQVQHPLRLRSSTTYVGVACLLMAVPFAQLWYASDPSPTGLTQLSITVIQAGTTHERGLVTWDESASPPPIRIQDDAPVSVRIHVVRQFAPGVGHLFIIAAPSEGRVIIDYDEDFADAVSVRLDRDSDGMTDEQLSPVVTFETRGLVDMQPPYVNADVETLLNNVALVTLRASDHEETAGSSGVAAIYFRVEGSPDAPQLYAGPVEFSGNTSIEFWAIDRRGLQGTRQLLVAP